MLTLAVCLAGAGCRSTYYAMWEGLGKEKRDLLKDQVEEAKEDQQQASEQFKDALTRLKELYGVDGGDLERAYNKLSGDYDKCDARAAQVQDRIERMETIAADLFREWEEEIETYSSANLKAGSQERLTETKVKYRALAAAMKKAESGMAPVLVQLKDQVLYLKHNLNAQAIGALRGEVVDIEKEIASLIQDMNQSIAEADAFIQTL